MADLGTIGDSEKDDILFTPEELQQILALLDQTGLPDSEAESIVVLRRKIEKRLSV